ncbi:MAG: GDSL-type esterase/lipase family protein, partial [Candidatus Ornithomonoglobus sp.]
DAPSEDVSTDAPSEDVSTNAPAAALDFKAAADTDVTAGAVYADNDKLTVVGTYASTLVGNAITIDDESFTNYIQVRIDSDPSTGTITEKSGSTPLVITAKKTGTLKLYYRRQTVDGACVSADGKDAKVSVKNADDTYTVQSGEIAVDTFTADNAYAYCTQTFDLAEGEEYLVWAKGTTLQIYGFSYTAKGEEITEAPTETATEDVPEVTEAATTAPTPEVVETKDLICSFTVDGEEVTINVTVGYDKDGNIVDVTTDSETYTVKPAVNNLIGIYAGETLIAAVEPTEKPSATETASEEATEIATEAATEAVTDAPAADGVYINESFESYDVAEIIRSTNSSVGAAPEPITIGSITYMAGYRQDGLYNIASIKQNGVNKYFNVSADNFATSSRGISFKFADEAGVPAVSDIPDGKVLVLDMDIESNQSFTLTGFGDIPAVTGTAAAVLSVADDAALAKAVLVPTESADSAVIVKAVYENGILASAVTETISNVAAGTPIEVEAAAGTKVMLWNSLEGMKPIAPTAVSSEGTPATTAPTEDAATTAPTEDTTTEAPTEDTTTEAPTEDTTTEAPTEDATTEAPTKDPDATEAPAPASGLPHLKAVIDPANNKQYVLITAADGTLVSSTVADLTATGFTGAEFFVGAGNFDIDNIKVSVKDADAGILSVKVTDDGSALADAAVTVGTLSAVTDTNGEAVFALPNGDYTVTASKSGYEHTEGLQDNATTTVTVNSDSQTAELTLSVMSYIKIPDTVTIEGGQEFIAAPKTSEPNKTAAFTVSVLDQYGIPMTTDEYGAAWSIFPAGSDEADSNVTIDENGVVSVAQGFNAANDTAAYDVTVVAATDDRNQKVTKTLIIGNNDISYYEPIGWEVAGGSRNNTTNLLQTVTLPDISSVTVRLNFGSFGNYSDNGRLFTLVAPEGKFVGVQLLSADASIKAFTGYNGTAAMNQYADLNNFTNSADLVSDYAYGTDIDVTFVIDKENSAVTVSCGTTSVSLPLTVIPTSITGLATGLYRYNSAFSVPNIMVKEPDHNYLSISGVNAVAKVSGTTVTRTYALGQSVIVPDETFTWSVSGDNTAVTIADGVLSIADTAEAGTYTITATSTINAEKTASFDVEVGDFQTITAANAEISGPQAYNLGTDTTGTYSITKAIDSYGDDVAAILPTAVWTSDNTDVATITEDGTLTVEGAGTATITATITNGTAVSTLTVPVTVAAYYVTAEATGNTTSIDTTALITDSHITGYQVTTSKDGAIVSQNVVTSAPSSVDTTNADKVEVAPVFEYAVGAPGTLGNLGAGYDIAIPADTYNFVVTDTGNRCDVYVNKQMLVNNILQGGSAVNYLAVNDIVVNEGVASITTADYASGQNETGVNISVKIVKSPSIVDRTKKIYVLGDSLVCIYYNGGSDENNTAQTGWGQVLQNYVTGAEVVDLGNSGVTANGLYGSAFTQVLTSSKPGDILVLESGYNDRTYDTEDIMKNALRNMYNEAKAIGVDVVFVSPNASVHDYNGSVVWTDRMEAVAAELNVPYIDLAQKSYDFLYGTYGSDTDTVLATYNVSDKLHSQYRGAQKWASIVAGGLIDLGFGDVINTAYTYTFTDTLGNPITCQA